MISVRGLYKSYDETPVLERVSLDVAEGEFCSIVGASGCGKSTFLRLLLGQEQPDRGEILLNDAPLPAEPSPERGIVYQRYSVFPHLTVMGNLMLAGDFEASPLLGWAFGAARKRTAERARDLLERVGLAAHAKRYPCLLYPSPSPRDRTSTRMPSSA